VPDPRRRAASATNLVRRRAAGLCSRALALPQVERMRAQIARMPRVGSSRGPTCVRTIRRNPARLAVAPDAGRDPSAGTFSIMGLDEIHVVRPPAEAASETAPELVPSPSGRDDGRRGSERWMSFVERVWDVLSLLSVLATWVVSRRSARPLADEAVRSLPGDELVADAKVRWKHAITIRARPAEIWPWLVQMGCRRAGWYSYDGLDNGGVRSAERIVPELQQVKVGDIFPMTPKAKDMFVVRMIEPERALVLGDAAGGMSWAFVLEPIDETATRLITRSKGAYHHLALGLLLNVFWHPLDFGMQRKQLLNLKRLVEAPA